MHKVLIASLSFFVASITTAEAKISYAEKVLNTANGTETIEVTFTAEMTDKLSWQDNKMSFICKELDSGDSARRVRSTKNAALTKWNSYDSFMNFNTPGKCTFQSLSPVKTISGNYNCSALLRATSASTVSELKATYNCQVAYIPQCQSRETQLSDLFSTKDEDILDGRGVARTSSRLASSLVNKSRKSAKSDLSSKIDNKEQELKKSDPNLIQLSGFEEPAYNSTITQSAGGINVISSADGFVDHMSMFRINGCSGE